MNSLWKIIVNSFLFNFYVFFLIMSVWFKFFLLNIEINSVEIIDVYLKYLFSEC